MRAPAGDGIDEERAAAVVFTLIGPGLGPRAFSGRPERRMAGQRSLLASLWIGGHTQLSGIADKTGGSALFAACATELMALCRRIAGRIRKQYALTYVSAGPQSAVPWRTVSVSVSDGGAKASDRKQYLGPGQIAPGEAPASTAVPPLVVAALVAGADNAALIAAVAVRRRSVRR